MLNHWIRGFDKPFYARREFQLNKPLSGASLSICGLGQFTAFLNGRKIGDHELDPAWTDYRKYIQYVEFDVADFLHPGTNVLGAEVGNGWYLKTDEHYTFAFPAFMPPNPNPYRPYGSSLILSAALELRYTDGSHEMIHTDQAWKIAPHVVTISNVYGSETIDNRLLQSGWCEAGFDDREWKCAERTTAPEAPLIKQDHPAVKVIRTVHVRRLGQRNGRTLYDLGQNLSGMLCLTAKGKRGDIIRVFPAEKLGADGDVDQKAKNWCDVNVQITCILHGENEPESFRMHFTYFAGRYLAVETDAEILALSADAISSGWKRDGTFSCDDERYNQIYTMIERTVEANLLGVHTDCPTIERFAWQEPNHLMAPSIFYMKDGRLLWNKFLRDMRAQQHTKDDFFLDLDGNQIYPGDGLMPSQCPCYIPNVLPVPGMGSFYDIIPWGSTCILGAWWHYIFYGDATILRDNYTSGLRYLNHEKTRVNADGFLNHGLGDWGNPSGELARENIETAFLYADTITLANMAAILDEPEREALLADAEAIREHYNRVLLTRHPEKGYRCYRCFDHPREVFLTQAAQALPLFWGMVPEDAEQDVARALRDTLERDGAFLCGEIGLPYVIQCARKYGMNDLICKMITKREHPSYYAFVLDGETTLGEYWEHNPRSHCHDMMGHIIEWFYNGIAGIRPLTPGFRKVCIRPYLPESMHWVECSYHSASGLISVRMQETDETIQLKIQTDSSISVAVDTSELSARGKKVITERSDIEGSDIPFATGQPQEEET